MILSKTCNYAIRAALYISANQRGRQFIPIREMSEKLDISFHFLTKILQVLTQKNLMISFKGPNGGVALAKPADEIYVMDIVMAIDGPGLFQNCLLGLNHCGDENPCPLHSQWAELREKLKGIFGGTSLADLSKGVAEHSFRLTNLEEEN